MFPSGRWYGHWEQAEYGRQQMRDLTLTFTGQVIDGSGYDVVGEFTFAGLVRDGGAVELVKQYHGQHAVVYHGQYDGEGTIAGTWSIGWFWRGSFVLRPERFAVPAEAGIEDIVPASSAKR